jgi:two-component sensor histidine kinase
MKGRLTLASTILSSSAETARPLRRRLVWLCFIGWTILVGLALAWLLQGNAGPSLWFVHGPDSPKPALAERFHTWFRADVGVQRVYPWVLLGPYIGLIAWYFPLERGRLRLNLAVNLVACVAFIGACHAIGAYSRVRVVNVTILKSGTTNEGRETITQEIQISTISPGGLLPERATRSGNDRPPEGAASYVGVDTHWDRPDAGLTNLPVEWPRGFPAQRPLPRLPKPGLWPVLLDLLAYGAVIGLVHAVHFYGRFRERERRALFLETNLANARLNALRAQLHPHFLFNSLNAIATLLRRDPRLAETTLMSLSDLLRLALSQSEQQEVKLRDELQFLERYLEIQQTRFGDKLLFAQEIDPATLHGLVPTLLLQPLVENAIRHGIEPAENGGLVRLTAHRQDESLVLTVEDDGVGLATTPVACDPSRGGNRIGLANLRTRLETLYGDRQVLQLASRPGGGVIVRVEIPWRPAPHAEPPGAINGS